MGWVIEMEILKKTYHDLRNQIAACEIELAKKKNTFRHINGKKENIVIKKIHDELYYYAQFREEGIVKSRYLGPVFPGQIADEENEQIIIGQLTKEIKTLEYEINSLKKVLESLKKRIKNEDMLDEFVFEVYWKDEITARVYVKKKYVIISKFTENPGKQLFAERKMTRYQLGKIFEMRCFEKGRPDIADILNHLGLSEYNPYEIVKKTHGVSYNDYIWFRFPGEHLTSRDVLVR